MKKKPTPFVLKQRELTLRLKMSKRVLWPSLERGTYVKSKHGELK